MKIAALNDSQHIGMCIYNVVILSVMAVIMSFVLSNHVDLHYALLSSFAILGTTVTQLIIFMPKVSLRERPLNKQGGAGFFLEPETFFCNTLESRNFFQEYMEPRYFFFTDSTFNFVIFRKLSRTFLFSGIETRFFFWLHPGPGNFFQKNPAPILLI